MKILTGVFAILALMALVAGFGMRATTADASSKNISQQALIPSLSAIKNVLQSDRVVPFSPVMKLANSCLKRGAGGCDPTLCKESQNWVCQANCCAGLTCRAVSVPGGTGGTECKK